MTGSEVEGLLYTKYAQALQGRVQVSLETRLSCLVQWLGMLSERATLFCLLMYARLLCFFCVHSCLALSNWRFSGTQGTR